MTYPLTNAHSQATSAVVVRGTEGLAFRVMAPVCPEQPNSFEACSKPGNRMKMISNADSLHRGPNSDLFSLDTPGGGG